MDGTQAIGSGLVLAGPGRLEYCGVYSSGFSFAIRRPTAQRAAGTACESSLAGAFAGMVAGARRYASGVGKRPLAPGNILVRRRCGSLGNRPELACGTAGQPGRDLAARHASLGVNGLPENTCCH